MREKYEFYREVIDEFWGIKPGEFISNPSGMVHITQNIYTLRRVLKHVVEARIADKYTVQTLKEIFLRIPEVLREYDFDVENHNTTHAGSRISGKLYSEDKGLLVVYILKDTKYMIINAYYREEISFRKLQNKYQ